MATTNVIAHKNLTDPQLHEPKGLSDTDTALTNTAYLSNGDGTGHWGFVPFSAIDYTASLVNLITGYYPMSAVTDVDVSVLTPVATGSVFDASIPLGANIDRASINTALAVANKNVKELGIEVSELRTELIKAFNNMDALKNTLNELRDTLINSGIITGTLSS